MDDKLVCPICQMSAHSMSRHVKHYHQLTFEEFALEYPDVPMQSESERLRRSSAGRKSLTTRWEDPDQRKEWTDRARNRFQERAWEANSKRFKEKWEDPEYRKAQSDRMKERHRDPNGALKKSIMRIAGKKRYKYTNPDGKIISMRSTWEVELAQYLDDNGIKYEFEKSAFKYEWYGNLKTYYPDFFIPSTNTYIEVKPLEFSKSEMSLAKRSSVVTAGHNYLFITEVELEDLDSIKLT